MRAFRVVVGDPFIEARAKLAARFEGVDIDALIFEAAPQPLDKHVVHPTDFAVHRDLDIGIEKHVNKARAGELAALVGVENGRFAIYRHRLLQGFDAEVSLHGVRQLPRQNLACCPIHHRDQIQKPFAHG